jgi:hypothetical protein
MAQMSWPLGVGTDLSHQRTTAATICSKSIVKQDCSMSHPPCFKTKKDFALWIELARFHPPPPADSYCSDCNPEHQKKMISEGRCEYPMVEFVVRLEELRKNKNGEVSAPDLAVEGVRPLWVVKLLRQGYKPNQIKNMRPKNAR